MKSIALLWIQLPEHVPMLQYIRKNFTLRLVRRVRLRHRAHQGQIAILDASLRTHSVRTPTLRVRAPQTPPGANTLHPPSSLNP